MKLPFISIAVAAASLAAAVTKQGWTQWPVNGHWYKPIVVASGISWKEAEILARQQGGYLATLQTSPENNFVFSLIQDRTFWRKNPANGANVGPWIGMYQPAGSQEPDGGWTWVTGDQATFKSWYPGEPNNLGGHEDYAHFLNYDANWIAAWNDSNDGTSPRNNPPIISLVVESPYAPSYWVQYAANGRFYRAVHAPLGISWTDAAAEAAAEGGHLATPTSAAENNFVFSLLDSNMFLLDQGQFSYIGPWFGFYQPPGSAEPAGGWTWVSGETDAFRNWEQGEPNNYLNIENWANYRYPVAQPSPTWNDFALSGYPNEPVIGFVIESSLVFNTSRYVLRDLGLPQGVPSVTAAAVANNGQVSGYTGTSVANGQAFVWNGGQFSLLQGYQQFSKTAALGSNASGMIGGQAFDNFGRGDIAYWANAQSPATLVLYGVFNGLNDNGWIVGSTIDQNTTKGFYYDTVSQTGNLATPLQGFDKFWTLAGLSDANEWVGTCYTDDPNLNPQALSRATIWSPDNVPTNIGVLSGDLFSKAKDINLSGLVVGDSGTFSAKRAFEYRRSTGLAQLPMPSGFVQTSAIAASDTGHVLGTGLRSNGTTDYLLWFPDRTVSPVLDLVGNLGNYQLIDLRDVNSNGVMVGNALLNGVNHGIMLQPQALADVVSPAYMYAVRGARQGGLVTDLKVRDGQYLKYGRGLALNLQEAPINLVFVGLSPFFSLQNLDFTITSSANSTGLNETIEAFDWQQGSYVTMADRSTSLTDRQSTFSLSAPTRFVKPDTREIQIRVRVRQTGPASNNAWSYFLDELNLSARP